ncbi:ectonucleotide pyrophosphatase/phosphodiesterase family member 5-like [Biomphalaria glabrata]|uniref:Ectonucleotide pyrophosphatase/phosphodiesterase family member 5-like n=1 Tax=Biomphalaria glabrata TaxID=6526 RepID=A0A9W3AS16_BIOGL|nr:ectonucleotide pyrophosphatase/phosphodiesterase family member 5-like [Biomphalaria glabrata]
MFSFIMTVLLLLLFNDQFFVNCWSNSFFSEQLFTNTSDANSLLLISFDGFRWDYIQSRRAKTPNFDRIISEGVTVQRGLKNAFVTKTFPNHYTLVTGMWEESHGIVGNQMYDPHLNQVFTPENISANSDPAWFDVGAEPIWVTNHLQKKGKSGVCMWVGGGAPVKKVHPDIFIPYNESFDDYNKIDTVVKWFSDDNPINLGLIYFDQPDAYGHKFGPDSSNVTEMIEHLDAVVGYLLEQLNKTSLLQKMNIILTSDHGFTNTPANKVIHLDKYVNSSLYNVSAFSPVALIWPLKGHFDTVYNGLKEGEAIDGNFSVYKKEDIPEYFHYKNNVRISPIIAVADDTYSFGTKEYPYPEHELGNHGYNNSLQDMHPFFIAMGPSFKKNFSVETFNSVDIYPLLCHLLHLTPAPNNGSLDIVSQLLIEEPTKIAVITLVTYILCISLILIVAGVFSAATIYYWNRSKYSLYTSLTSSESPLHLES